MNPIQQLMADALKVAPSLITNPPTIQKLDKPIESHWLRGHVPWLNKRSSEVRIAVSPGDRSHRVYLRHEDLGDFIVKFPAVIQQDSI